VRINFHFRDHGKKQTLYRNRIMKRKLIRRREQGKMKSFEVHAIISHALSMQQQSKIII